MGTGMGSATASRSEVAGGEGREGHVALVDGGLRVVDWRTRNGDIVRFFQDRLADDGDLAEVLELALKVGVLALGSAGITANVDYVEKEFQRLSSQVDATLRGRVEDVETALRQAFADDDGALARVLDDYLGDEGHLAELFDSDRRDSALGRLRGLLAEHFDGESSTLHKMLDLGNPSGPLASWKRELEGQFSRLQRQIEDYRTEVGKQAAGQVARAEEREKGTHKGRDFEASVFAALNGIAGVFGDAAEATGDIAATGGGKVGDVVVTLNERDTRGAAVRLVVEAKDGQVGLTPMLRELDEAKENRGAVAAIAVYSHESCMPSGTAPFREQGGGRYLCLFDKETDDVLCLQLAYRVARFWALAELSADDGEVDARGIREDLETARRQLQNLATVKRKLTRMRNSVEEACAGVESEVEQFRAGLIQVFDRVDGRIRVGGAGG
jgi:hypothetical protein